MLIGADTNCVVEQAVAHAVNGCSCSQAIAYAFSQHCGLDKRLLLQMSSGLAGGMGGAGETCGVVSASVIVLGAVFGPCAIDDVWSRGRTMKLSLEFVESFTKANGSPICSQLSHGADLHTPEGIKALRESGRPEQLIRSGAQLLSKLLMRECGAERL